MNVLKQPLQIPDRREGGINGKASSKCPPSSVCLKHFCLECGSVYNVGRITEASLYWALAPHNGPMRQVPSYLPFYRSGNWAQRGQVTCARSHRIQTSLCWTPEPKLLITTSNSLDGVGTLMLHKLCLSLLGIVSQDSEATGENLQEDRARPEPGSWGAVDGTEETSAEGLPESGGQAHSHGNWVAWGWRTQLPEAGCLSSS